MRGDLSAKTFSHPEHKAVKCRPPANITLRYEGEDVVTYLDLGDPYIDIGAMPCRTPIANAA
jgi:hypothetical protein